MSPTGGGPGQPEQGLDQTISRGPCPPPPGPPVIPFPSLRDAQCNAEENGEGGIPAQTVLSESGQNYDEQASNVKIPNQ